MGEFPEYPNFAALSAVESEGRDFERLILPRRSSKIAILAPHGGCIEPRTDAIARQIAGNEFSVYCFEAKKPRSEGNLHITSHNFDDEACLNLLKGKQWVVAVHGCQSEGQRVLLGGLDHLLIEELTLELRSIGIGAEVGNHKFPGTHPRNICNRGASGKGVQFELSMPFRRGPAVGLFVEAVRAVLFRQQSS